ncbi:hypothetical protein ABPG72_009940 [Tetrahymena utriculariae]
MFYQYNSHNRHFLSTNQKNIQLLNPGENEKTFFIKFLQYQKIYYLNLFLSQHLNDSLLKKANDRQKIQIIKKIDASKIFIETPCQKKQQRQQKSNITKQSNQETVDKKIIE